MTIESRFRAARDEGRSLLVPYLTGGLGEWRATIEEVAAAGADAIEIGIPFSDPIMDGPVIQESSQQALRSGATPQGIVAELAGVDVGVPLVVMTYYNPVHHMGHQRFADALGAAGVSGSIVPDLPVDESEPWIGAAEAAGVENILLAAPTTTDERLATICERSCGWIYGIALLGVTGERSSVAAAGLEMGRRLKAATDKPVLLGLGISNGEQAKTVAAVADGVIVGSAVVRRQLEGRAPAEVGAFVASLRAGLDAP
ncbi:MAG: tryptophan synthase subunit alpha [Actinomycetes bacterium]